MIPFWLDRSELNNVASLVQLRLPGRNHLPQSPLGPSQIVGPETWLAILEINVRSFIEDEGQ
jgi:hypothetical protein